MCSQKTSSLPVPDRHIHISASLLHGPGFVNSRSSFVEGEWTLPRNRLQHRQCVINVNTLHGSTGPDHLLVYLAFIHPMQLSSGAWSPNSLRSVSTLGIYPYFTLVKLHPYHYLGSLWNAEYQFYRYGFDRRLLERYASACQSCPTLARVDGNGHRRPTNFVNYQHDHACFSCCKSWALAQAVKDFIHNIYL